MLEASHFDDSQISYSVTRTFFTHKTVNLAPEKLEHNNTQDKTSFRLKFLLVFQPHLTQYQHIDTAMLAQPPALFISVASLPNA